MSIMKKLEFVPGIRRIVIWLQWKRYFLRHKFFTFTDHVTYSEAWQVKAIKDEYKHLLKIVVYFLNKI